MKVDRALIYDLSLEIEAMYRIAQQRRLSNSETVNLAYLEGRLENVARAELTRPVPEASPSIYEPVHWRKVNRHALPVREVRVA